MVSRTRQGQAALFGRMAQHDPAVFGITGSAMEYSTCKDPRLSRIIRLGVGARFMRCHFRRDHKGGRGVKQCHTVGDGGHMPIGERDQTPGCDQYLFAGRRLPEDLPIERPGFHVEPPVVAQEVCIGQPEGLVVGEELDDLAVGYAEDGLAGFREAISVFRVHDRAGFIKPIDQSAVFGVRAAFFRAPAHAEVSVAERQHRLQLGQEFGVKPFFDDVPLVRWVIMGWRPEAFMMDHRAAPRTTGWGIGLAAYIDTSSVAPSASFTVVATIRISNPSPSISVACTVLPAMRIATKRPLQHTRNDRLRHCGGSLGSMPSISPFRSRPAKPRIMACHRPPSPAIRMPPALFGSSSRSSAAAWRRKRSAVSVSPSRAATSAWIPALNELPWAQRGS